MRSPGLFLSLLLFTAPLLAAPPRSDLQPLRWLAGEWQGDGPTGRVEAFWLPPEAGTMAGVLRRIREGRIHGYALAVIAEQDGSLVLRLKRFDAQLTGRDSQEASPPRQLVDISEAEVSFEGVRVKHSGAAMVVEFGRPGERPEHVRLSRVTRPRPTFAPASPEEAPALRGTPASDMPPARIGALGWLSGDWTGQGLGGVSEEAWLPPEAGSLAGVYRGTRGGQVSFYELMTVVEVAGSLVFRLKHFAPDLRGWESPERAVEFPLVRASRSSLVFDGLTYRRTAEGLESWIVVGLGDGGTRSERFVYTPRVH